MNYKKLKRCRLCSSNNLSTFIDFKKMHLQALFYLNLKLKMNFYIQWRCNFVIIVRVFRLTL